jgi:uncharacterized protein YecT (DUF1311 family)
MTVRSPSHGVLACDSGNPLVRGGVADINAGAPGFRLHASRATAFSPRSRKGHSVLLRLASCLTPFRLIGLLLASPFLLDAAGTSARAAEGAADRTALAGCLALVKKNEAARGLHGSDELSEKSGPEGRLAAARSAAPRKADSCIGAVSAACIQGEGNESTATMVQCYGREADAWDARLNAAYKTLMANGDGQDVADGLRKTQRAWIAFRDAACAQPAVVFKGTMAGPMTAWCVLELTARQALWLEGWLQ